MLHRAVCTFLYQRDGWLSRNREKATKIYNKLRTAWERALEDFAFSRVVLRHRNYIDFKPLKKVTVLTEADCETFQAGFQKCCDEVDAHDPSRARNAEARPHHEIMQDIKVLKDLVAIIRARQKTLLNEVVAVCWYPMWLPSSNVFRRAERNTPARKKMQTAVTIATAACCSPQNAVNMDYPSNYASGKFSLLARPA